MAQTLTDAGELLYLSFAIDKVESTPDGDLYVYGKATDGSVDHDQQIVDPAFSSKAIADWLATGGNVRVQHQAQRDPAGRGVSVNTDDSGATWVKAEVVEPIAKRLVSKGVLRAYSVGIANPTIERDVTGKARGGIIKNGKIIEISLVDRPANASCGIQLVKSAVDGTAEYAGELFGKDAIVKALSPDVTKTAGPAVKDAVNNVDKFTVPDDVNLDFTPNDLMRILAEKTALKAVVTEEKEILGKDHREFSADRRRSLASQGNALPDGSYPIPDKDALRRAAILARSGHGNVSAARRLIARRAKELGVPNPLDSDDSQKSIDTADEELQAALKALGDIPVSVKAGSPAADNDHDEDDDDNDGDSVKNSVPDVVKDPADGDGPGKPKKKGGKAGKGGKKLPPWMNNKKNVGKFQDPKSASGAEEAAPMQSAPCDGEPLESPKPDHMKAAAVLRYKTIGMDTGLGILHDMTCAAFHPDDVAKCHPGITLASAIDESVWQGRALAAATGKSISEAVEAQAIWKAARDIKTADQQDLYQFRVALHKAFRDANPGPTSFPSPCAISPEKFHRPCITEGHASYGGSSYGSPNSNPHVATSAPNAHHFDNPPLSAGHQSPSPSHMKSSFEYPEQQGVPTQIRYGEIEKEKARRALTMLHDHLNHMFPSACPMLDQDAYRQEDGHNVALPVAVGKSAPADELGGIFKYMRKLEKKVRAGQITEADARERVQKRTAEKYASNLAKEINDGLTSREAVLRALGIEGAAGAGHVAWQGKAAAPAPEPVSQVSQPVVKNEFSPDVMKTMMSDILKPFEEKLEAQTQHIENQNRLLGEYQEKFSVQEKELAEQKSRWDALANQPDPSTAAFSGLALNPVHQRPAVVKQADINERAQAMVIRQLERTWRQSEHPAEREAAYKALMQYKGMTD